MAAGTGVLALALWAIGASAGDASAAGAYVAFTAALLVWGWQEMSYYMGFVSGPRAAGCPPGARGLPRFRAAAATSLWHEAAIVAGGLAILALTWGQPNHFALWTYLVLWGMNLSARLNLFLGVRNLNAEFLPEHLAYLGSYLRVRAMNPLFPVSVTAAGLATAALVAGGPRPRASRAHEVAGLSILATLMALATLEHGFLMLPLPSAALWQWSLPKMARRGPVPSPVPAARGEGARVGEPRLAEAEGR